MIALIDGDLVCYRCAASAENDPFDIAVIRANELLDRILIETEAKEFKVYLTGKDNFRKTIYPEYKAHRTQPKPVHLEALREYAVTHWNAIIVDGMEADDALAIYQTSDTVICSLDKDLKQIPGKHYSWEISGKNWNKPASHVTVEELEGLRHFYEQLLKGDKSDNIHGIEGIGEVKAKLFLADCESELDMFKVVRHKYGNDDEMLMNGRVLWLKRSPEDDWKVRFEELQKQAGTGSLEETKNGVSVDEV